MSGGLTSARNPLKPPTWWVTNTPNRIYYLKYNRLPQTCMNFFYMLDLKNTAAYANFNDIAYNNTSLNQIDHIMTCHQMSPYAY